MSDYSPVFAAATRASGPALAPIFKVGRAEPVCVGAVSPSRPCTPVSVPVAALFMPCDAPTERRRAAKIESVLRAPPIDRYDGNG